jgi:hypothetical protein
LQCYARLLHLIAHYELGNMEVVNYLSKSVYRFMGKMDNLSTVEEILFNFLKKSIQKYGRAGVAGMNKEELKQAFEELLILLRPLQQNKLESRAFMYLDIISWLESRIQEKEVQSIIREKFIAKKSPL